VVAAAAPGVGGIAQPVAGSAAAAAAAAAAAVPPDAGSMLLVCAAAAAGGARYTVSCLSGVRAILMMRLFTYAARRCELGTSILYFCVSFLCCRLVHSMTELWCCSCSPVVRQTATCR
jgi:hypothetical protein